MNSRRSFCSFVLMLLVYLVLLATGPPVYADNWDEYRLWSYMPADKLDLYIHRKPIATFSVSMSPVGSPPTSYNISIPSDAYDLDHQSQPDKGIVEHKWTWKSVTAFTWNVGKPTTLTANGDYLIRYEVKDYEGAWSDPKVAYITTRNVNLPPVAQFTITPNPAVVNRPVVVNDMSYDPNGTPISQRQWRVKSPSGTWSSLGSSPPVSFNAVGEWQVELKVSDGPLWSEPYYQTVTLIPDNNPPIARFTVSPNPAYDYETITYNDTSYDPDGDPIVAREWRIRENSGAWQYYVNPPTNFEPGTYDIELRVRDQPKLPQLTPMWSNWYRQTLVVRESFYVTGTITPNPAERGRKIRIVAEAKRITDNALTQVDHMTVTIPNPTKPGGGSSLPVGQNPIQATMTYNPATGTYTYEYLIPEKSQAGYWPDDGNYYIKITGTKGTVTKEALVLLQIKGHVLRRVIIQTTEW